MRLEQLILTNYRNIEAADLLLHPRLTIFLGPNGSGKTNILEALHLLTLPRSFRGGKDEQLKLWSASFARVEGSILLDSGQHRSMVVFVNGGKKLQVDGRPVTATEFVGQFLSTLFAPEEVDLLSGPPTQRRAFLDGHISQISSSYFVHLLHYNKVLVRKNRLLSHQASRAELAYWNEQQCLHGVAIIEARLKLIDRFNSLLSPTLRMEYRHSLGEINGPLNEIFQQKQASILERERAVGHSLVGPQRDEWRLIETEPIERDLGVYGSRGEQRMGVITLKQTELTDLQTVSGQQPVLLLDDVLSELDATNQQRLLSSLGEHQTILTTASLADVPDEMLSDALIYSKSGNSWIIEKPNAT